MSKRIVLVLTLALALAGCGRRGFVEAPPDGGSAGVNAAATATDGTTDGLSSGGGLRKKDPGIQKPKRSFILDPLL